MYIYRMEGGHVINAAGTENKKHKEREKLRQALGVTLTINVLHCGVCVFSCFAFCFLWVVFGFQGFVCFCFYFSIVLDKVTVHLTQCTELKEFLLRQR